MRTSSRLRLVAGCALAVSVVACTTLIGVSEITYRTEADGAAETDTGGGEDDIPYANDATAEARVQDAGVVVDAWIACGNNTRCAIGQVCCFDTQTLRGTCTRESECDASPLRCDDHAGCAAMNLPHLVCCAEVGRLSDGGYAIQESHCIAPTSCDPSGLQDWLCDPSATPSDCSDPTHPTCARYMVPTPGYFACVP